MMDFFFSPQVRHSELVSVLNFMYHGEVSVAQDDLEAFLAAAEELSVKGLTTGQQQEPGPFSSSSSKPGPLSAKRASSRPPAKRARTAEAKEEDEEETREITIKDERVVVGEEELRTEEQDFDPGAVEVEVEAYEGYDQDNSNLAEAEETSKGRGNKQI